MRIREESKMARARFRRIYLPMAALAISGLAGWSKALWAESPTPVPEAVVVPSVSGAASPMMAKLKTLVASGKLTDLIYSDFSDNQAQVAAFYQDGGYAPVWFVGGKLTPQANELIKCFAAAQEKGLNPDDYDGPRWAARV
ncbi:MAG TPA: hypothetical protein VHY56_10005, partial [Candidatus Binataceae bacterium]|nr:hypothetical protein [Candidatus Binataceae bacterium]